MIILPTGIMQALKKIIINYYFFFWYYASFKKNNNKLLFFFLVFFIFAYMNKFSHFNISVLTMWINLNFHLGIH